jgi:transposase
MIDAFTKVEALVANWDCEADWFRAALGQKGITPCIQSKRSLTVPIPHDTAFSGQRHKLENLFSKLKNCRRIHTIYDRCPYTFSATTCIASTVILWPTHVS